MAMSYVNGMKRMENNMLEWTSTLANPQPETSSS